MFSKDCKKNKDGSNIINYNELCERLKNTFTQDECTKILELNNNTTLEKYTSYENFKTELEMKNIKTCCKNELCVKHISLIPCIGKDKKKIFCKLYSVGIINIKDKSSCRLLIGGCTYILSLLTPIINKIPYIHTHYFSDNAMKIILRIIVTYIYKVHSEKNIKVKIQFIYSKDKTSLYFKILQEIKDEIYEYCNYDIEEYKLIDLVNYYDDYKINSFYDYCQKKLLNIKYSKKIKQHHIIFKRGNIIKNFINTNTELSYMFYEYVDMINYLGSRDDDDEYKYNKSEYFCTKLLYEKNNILKTILDNKYTSFVHYIGVIYKGKNINRILIKPRSKNISNTLEYIYKILDLYSIIEDSCDSYDNTIFMLELICHVINNYINFQNEQKTKFIKNIFYVLKETEFKNIINIYFIELEKPFIDTKEIIESKTNILNINGKHITPFLIFANIFIEEYIIKSGVDVVNMTSNLEKCYIRMKQEFLRYFEETNETKNNISEITGMKEKILINKDILRNSTKNIIKIYPNAESTKKILEWSETKYTILENEIINGMKKKKIMVHGNFGVYKKQKEVIISKLIPAFLVSRKYENDNSIVWIHNIREIGEGYKDMHNRKNKVLEEYYNIGTVDSFVNKRDIIDFQNLIQLFKLIAAESKIKLCINVNMEINRDKNICEKINILYLVEKIMVFTNSEIDKFSIKKNILEHSTLSHKIELIMDKLYFPEKESNKDLDELLEKEKKVCNLLKEIEKYNDTKVENNYENKNDNLKNNSNDFVQLDHDKKIDANVTIKTYKSEIGKCILETCKHKSIKNNDLYVEVKCSKNCDYIIHYSCWRPIFKSYDRRIIIYNCLKNKCDGVIIKLLSKDNLKEKDLLIHKKISPEKISPEIKSEINKVGDKSINNSTKNIVRENITNSKQNKNNNLVKENSKNNKNLEIEKIIPINLKTTKLISKKEAYVKESLYSKNQTIEKNSLNKPESKITISVWKNPNIVKTNVIENKKDNTLKINIIEEKNPIIVVEKVSNLASINNGQNNSLTKIPIKKDELSDKIKKDELSDKIKKDELSNKIKINQHTINNEYQICASTNTMRIMEPLQQKINNILPRPVEDIFINNPIWGPPNKYKESVQQPKQSENNTDSKAIDQLVNKIQTFSKRTTPPSSNSVYDNLIYPIQTCSQQAFPLYTNFIYSHPIQLYSQQPIPIYTNNFPIQIIYNPFPIYNFPPHMVYNQLLKNISEPEYTQIQLWKQSR